MIELIGNSTRVEGWIEYRCAKCQTPIHSPYPAENVICGCDQVGQAIDYSTCIHRREELRREECPSCSSSLKIKVFACSEKFRECTIGKSLEGIQCCNQCPAFESPTGLKHALADTEM